MSCDADDSSKNFENIKATVRTSFARIYASLKARELKTLRQLDALRKQCQDDKELSRNCVQEIRLCFNNESALLENIYNYGAINLDKLNFDSQTFSLEDYVKPEDDHMYMHKAIEEATNETGKDDLEIEEAALKQITAANDCVCYVNIRSEEVSQKFRDLDPPTSPVECSENSFIKECLEVTEDEKSFGSESDSEVKKRDPSHKEHSEVTRCLVTKGCPQGGVLSPLLWVLVANELLDSLNKDGLQTIGYADDLAIMISGLFESTLCEKMQKALRIVEAWCHTHSLTVNPSKIELVLFTRKLKLPNLNLPSLFGTKLALSKEVKYLGIWLDSKLLWGKQLEHVMTKATNVLWQCRRAVGKDWGLKPKLCLWMYTVMVRPVLTYGAVVWWPRTNLVTTISKLQQVQRLACALISGCAKSTPSAGLDMILGLTPLHLHIQQEAMAAALRIRSTNQWKSSGKPTNHSRILDKAIQAIPEAVKGTDRIATTYLTDKKYQIESQRGTVDPISTSNIYHVYTDGSKQKAGAGCGFYCPEMGLSRAQPLSNTTTAFQAETLGLLLAAAEMLTILESKTSADTAIERTILIFTTDSAALINALGRSDTRSESVAKCHTALQELAKMHTVKIKWTKSHGSCSGNNEADSLAKEGAKQTPTTDDLGLCKPPSAEIRNRLKMYSHKEHQKQWERRSDCKHTKTMLPTMDKHITTNLLKMKREDLKLMVGIITGHCDLNYHLMKTGATDSDLCRGCLQDKETVEHVVLHCSATEEARSKTGLRELIESCPSTSTSVSPSGLLEHCCHQPKVLLRYFKELGWLG